MLSVRRCTACRRSWGRAECRVDPDGLFGPERLCPRCGAATEGRLTPLGWAVALLAAPLAAAGVALWSGWN